MLLATVGLSKSIAQTITINTPNGSNYLCPGTTYTLTVPGGTTYCVLDAPGTTWTRVDYTDATLILGTPYLGTCYQTAYLTLYSGSVTVYTWWDNGGTPDSIPAQTYTVISTSLSENTNNPCVGNDVEFSVSCNYGPLNYSWSFSSSDLSGYSSMTSGPSNFCSVGGKGDTYYVTVTANGTGCACATCTYAIDSFTSSVSAPTTPTTISADYLDGHCAAQDIILTTSSDYATSYQWYAHNWVSPYDAWGFVQNPTPDSTADVVIGAYDQGEYVTVKGINGCGESMLSDSLYLWSSDEADCGGERTENSKIVTKEFSVYPNPASTIVTLMLGNPKETYVVSILDLEGQLIESYTTHGINFEIDISKLPTGLYLISSCSDKEQHYSKLSIVR